MKSAPPYLQIYPDMGNLTNAAVLYQYDVCQDIALGRGHFAAAHLKETRPGVFREVPFGEGHVDFPHGSPLLSGAGRPAICRRVLVCAGRRLEADSGRQQPVPPQRPDARRKDIAL